MNPLTTAIERLLKDPHSEVRWKEPVQGVDALVKNCSCTSQALLSNDLATDVEGRLDIEFKKDIKKSYFELNKNEKFEAYDSGALTKKGFVPDGYAIISVKKIKFGKKEYENLLNFSGNVMQLIIEKGYSLNKRSCDLLEEYYQKII